MASPSPTATTRPPVNYIGVGLPGPGAVPSVAPTATTSTSIGALPPRPQAHQTIASTSTSPATTPVSCPPDLVSSLLDSITGLVSPSGGGLLPIGDLLAMLTGGLGLGVPTLSLSSLLDQVTYLLSAMPVIPGIGSSTGSSTPALASACTTALSKIVPTVGGGG
jgi:hypothetical protein